MKYKTGMTLTPTDIMLGDIVACDLSNLIEDPFFNKENKDTSFVKKLSDPSEIGDSVYDLYKGIILTTDIMKKIGFVGEGYLIYRVDENKTIEWYAYEKRIRIYWQGVDEWQNHAHVKDLVFQCNCNYLHEFQHAMKLAGIQLEINL